MSTWQVVYSEQAEWDLRSIFEYIACSLVSPEAARKQVRCIIEAIARLDLMPYRYSLYENEPWQSRGLRVLPVDNYLVFYMPVEDLRTVAVIRIMYGGRSIEEHLGHLLQHLIEPDPFPK